ncbi:MAG TPA: pyruvate formate lyase family protein [Candidatus Dormibacteraeota bacterium]|nr:pyruvate formate lyase family protein [Candidatus Dormibacteraeota bacterium]
MVARTAVASHLKEPHGLSPRIRRLRDYYFEGVRRPWNNEFTCWTTGAPWDVVYDETSYYIVPETYAFFSPFRASALQAARPVDLHPDFWRWSLVERRAWLIRKVMVDCVPQELLPGDLIAGGRFNILASRCWNRREARAWKRGVDGRNGARTAALRFHEHGYGNAGATSGHLIPDHERALRIGWKGIHDDLQQRHDQLSPHEQRSERGAQLRAMMTAATMPRALAAKYSALCADLAAREGDSVRRAELEQMAANLERVPWEPATTFWEALQALWLNHMLVMSDENYPGPGVSFGRFDQYLLPFWQESCRRGMTRDAGKELLECFWVHANTAYDAMIRIGGNQGITSGFGQLVTLSGMGPNRSDTTNELTYVVLDVIDEMSPILEPKPTVRLHRGSPDALLDRVVDMVAVSQGSPFLLNFDERSMAGMLREAREARCDHLIHAGNVHDYAPVGCLENTMVGNDRSGTVDVNLNLLKAVELALTGGADLMPPLDPVTGAERPPRRDGPATGDASRFTSWQQFWDAYAEQTRFIVRRAVDLYDRTESLRARFSPTPYLSCLVRGCAEQARDVTQGGAELNFVTIEAVTFATTVDALLAVKYLVFDEHRCSMAELTAALRDNWRGHDTLRAWARFRAPKYGRDDASADEMARQVMELWTTETWTHRTSATRRRFRPGMLSWNYWVGDGFILAASADGRPRGQFLSNAICPSNGADIHGPTANVNSVGVALGGRVENGGGDWDDYVNLLPNGASHTITFSPSLLRDAEHRQKFKGFLRGYCENGGTALQINVIDAETLKDAQRRPDDYRNLLVRVTGYNAYFTSIGRELQDEIIARELHSGG